MKVDIIYYNSSKEFLVYFKDLTPITKALLKGVVNLIGYKIKDDTNSTLSIRANFVSK